MRDAPPRGPSRSRAPGTVEAGGDSLRHGLLGLGSPGTRGVLGIRGGAPVAEPVPFAFTTDDRRQHPGEWARPGDVAPPRPERVSARTLCGRVAVGLLLVSGLVAAVALGTPALSAHGADPGDRSGARPAPAHGRR